MKWIPTTWLCVRVCVFECLSRSPPTAEQCGIQSNGIVCRAQAWKWNASNGFETNFALKCQLHFPSQRLKHIFGPCQMSLSDFTILGCFLQILLPLVSHDKYNSEICRVRVSLYVRRVRSKFNICLKWNGQLAWVWKTIRRMCRKVYAMIYAIVTRYTAHLFPSQSNAKWAFFFRPTKQNYPLFRNQIEREEFSIRWNGRCIRNSRFNTSANDLKCFHCPRYPSVQAVWTHFSFFCLKVGQSCGSMNILGNQLSASSPISHASWILIDSIMDHMSWEDLVLACALAHAGAVSKKYSVLDNRIFWHLHLTFDSCFVIRTERW